MDLIHLLLVIALVGFVAWLIDRYIPMDDVFKTLFRVVLVIVVILWLLSAIGYGGPYVRLR